MYDIICPKCNTNKIPKGRIDLGFNVCVECSTVEAVSCVDITYHKTGNTIQITDKATADRLNKLSQRSGYGIMRGLRSGKAPKSTPTKIEPNTKPTRHYRQYTHDDLKSVLEDAVEYMELGMRKKAIQHVESSLESNRINGVQRRKAMEILDVMFPRPVKEVIINEQEPIDEEIQFAFRNWKNSKIYR